jgi:Na+-driven multidrug efflux pump
MLDRLRWIFPFVVAVVLPLAGIVLAAARLVEGDHDEARQLAGATLLGVALYAFFVFG